MKKILLLFFCFAGLLANAQKEKDFDEFGRRIVRQLTTTHRFDSIPIMRMREVREFLRGQIRDSARLAKEIYIRDAAYGDLYLSFQKSIVSVKNSYENQNNIKVEYLDTYHEHLPDNLKNTYQFIVSFIHKEGELENEVQFIFDAAWHKNSFVFLGPLTEKF
jgi:hypothetical protein